MGNSHLANSFVTNASTSFKKLCLKLLDTAYAELYTAKVVTRDWDENAISEVLVCIINDNPFAIGQHITARTEKRLLPENYLNALPKVDGAYRIDIEIGGFGWSSNEYRTKYYMEAKNLYCQNFKKTNHKGWTSSIQYVNRYIETGVDNLLKEHYPSNTLLLGYVLVGTVRAAVDLLNLSLSNISRDAEKIELKRTSEFLHLELGYSIHAQGMALEHCFLMFQ